MAPGRNLGKRLEARFEGLAGPEEKRVTIYAVKRYLDIDFDDWYVMPWWLQRVYLDGLNKEKPWEREAGAEAGGVPQPESQPEPEIDGSLGDFAAFGIKAEEME